MAQAEGGEGFFELGEVGDEQALAVGPEDAVFGQLADGALYLLHRQAHFFGQLAGGQAHAHAAGVGVSVSDAVPPGIEGNGPSGRPILTGDGQAIAFQSSASNLVVGDNNRVSDIFLAPNPLAPAQPAIPKPQLVSVFSNGNPTIQFNDGPSVLSANGQFVVFNSLETGLDPNNPDLPGIFDVFVRDRGAAGGGITELVSMDSNGVPGNTDSGITTLNLGISDNGNVVIFSSNATNLAPGATNGLGHYFAHNRATGVTQEVDVADVNQPNAGQEGNAGIGGASISPGGTLIAFHSYSTNLVGISAGDNIYVRDLVNQTTTLVSLDGLGNPANDRTYEPSISANGRYVAFVSLATNLDPACPAVPGIWNIFVRDLAPGGTTVCMTANANDMSFYPRISTTGRFVVFESAATTLVPGDTNGMVDIFVYDRQVSGLGAFDQVGNTSMTRVNVPTGGGQSVGDPAPCFFCGSPLVPSISDNGRFVLFSSIAGDLVVNDVGGFLDVFIHDLQPPGGATFRVSTDAPGNQGNNDSPYGNISRDGTCALFGSLASNLVAGDVNGVPDWFVTDNPALLPGQPCIP